MHSTRPLTPRQRRSLEVIRAAQAAGQPVPSYLNVAEALRERQPERIRDAMRRLAYRGIIPPSADLGIPTAEPPPPPPRLPSPPPPRERQSLTPRQAECLAAVRRLAQDAGNLAPSSYAVAAALGISAPSAQRLMRALVERGYAVWAPHLRQAFRLVDA